LKPPVSGRRAPEQACGNTQDPRFPQPYPALRFIPQRELVASATPSATCPRESVLPIRLRPDFSVVFEGYARSPFHRSRHAATPKRSLGASILRGSALRAIWCRAVRTCYIYVFASVRTSHSAKPSAHDATLASEKAAFELGSRWTWFIDQPVLARQHLRAW